MMGSLQNRQGRQGRQGQGEKTIDSQRHTIYRLVPAKQNIGRDSRDTQTRQGRTGTAGTASKQAGTDNPLILLYLHLLSLLSLLSCPPCERTENRKGEAAMKGKSDCIKCHGIGFTSYTKAGVSYSQPCSCTVEETAGVLPDTGKRLKHLLAQIGEPGHCRGCGHKILWVVHRNGKKTPYTEEGLNHFIDCPAGDLFRRAKSTAT